MRLAVNFYRRYACFHPIAYCLAGQSKFAARRTVYCRWPNCCVRYGSDFRYFGSVKYLFSFHLPRCSGKPSSAQLTPIVRDPRGDKIRKLKEKACQKGQYFKMFYRTQKHFKCSSVLQLKLLIAKISRVMEVCGYSISLLVLFFALLAFCYFR